MARERRPSGKDVWRYENPDVALPKEHIELLSLGWTVATSSRETLGLRSTARAQAFKILPADEQEAWNERAQNYKPPAPTK